MTCCNEDPEMTLVRETPGLDADVSVASPVGLCKEGKSSSRLTITEPSIESPNQTSLHPKSLTSRNEDPSRDEYVITITPKKDVIQNTSSLMQGSSLTVTSNTQKRKKFMSSPVIDLVDDDAHKALDSGNVNMTRNLEMYRESTRRIEFDMETCCAEDKFKKITDSQSPAVKSSAMERRLQISCSLCRSHLCLQDNIVSCSITSTSKSHLLSLVKERTELRDSTVSRAIPVIMTDTSSVDPRLYDKPLGRPAEHGVWCKEDGCVFNNMFCPFCSFPKKCLDVQVAATDSAYVQLLDKVLFFLDHLELRDSEASENKISNMVLPSSISSTMGKTAVFDSIEKFSFTSKNQDSGGWRTTKSKMRLPKRCQLSSSES